MAIEPTSIQRDRMLVRGKTSLTLAQFLVQKKPGELKEYFRETHRAVLEEGGTRDHQLRIDQGITAGEFPYQYLIVDSFPSSQSLLMAHENTREIRGDALAEVYAILIRPNPWMPRIAKLLGGLESIFTRWLNTSGIKIDRDPSSPLDPETDPDLEKVAEFRSSDLGRPFYMMNLNQFKPDGKRSYNQYSTRIAPYLVSVGGYPDIYGKILSTYIGDQKSSLSNRWHDFALVYYPSRTSFLRLMSNTPRGAAEVRRAGLKKVVLMGCSQSSP